ncbi:MAG: hypothetical protein IPN71_06205 [Fibrobacteres bacterium]|nr:hypothetical protein [Fibrobacterota bacterium]
MGAAFFEHFLQSQCSSPLGEPRSQNFGNIHSIEHFSLDQRVIEEENSGTFPISGNTHWHSGIHLITANDREMVLAPMAGEIIAARFSGKNTDDEKIKYGSPNFLLIRHRFHRTIEPVFTLLMNLGEFSKGFDAEIDVPWIKRAKKENVKLKAGVINKLSIPVLPGEKVGYPGSLGGNKGLHFEVFSKANIYENELQPLDVAAHPPTLAALTEFPSVTSFLITKVRPGNSYVLAGQNARFEVESVANGLTAENLAKIRWQIRVISEDGKELVNQQSSQGGVSYLMNFPDDSDFYWAQVIAQPFIEGSQPDPRLVIFRYILPGRIQNAYPVVVPANPKRIADCLKVHFAPDSNSAKKLAAVENCNEASLLLKRELIWSSDQAIRRILDGIILLMDPPWDLGGNKSRKEMDANGFRWDWESFEPYSWWGDAIAKQIPLPASGTKLHYFHPSRFLRSLPLISDSLHWINEASLLEGEKKYAGENYSIKDVGNGSHAIVRKNKDTTFPVETEW